MLQRLGIADALVKDPDVLILDEPTTAIDPLGVVEILDLLRGARRRARDGDPPLEPPAQPGPVGLRPDRHLRRRPADRAGDHGRARRALRRGQRPDRGRRSRRRRRRRAPSTAEASSAAIDGVATVVATADRRRRPVARSRRRRPRARRRGPRRRSSRRRSPSRLPLVSIRPVEPSLEDIYRRAVARTAPAARSRGMTRRERPPTDGAAPRPRPPADGRRAARPAPERSVPRAGWMVVAGKEFADHLLSARFVVLLIVLGLAAAIPLYFAADAIRPSRPGERPAGALPRPVRLAPTSRSSRSRSAVAVVHRARRAAARARVRVRRRQRRARRGDAAAAPLPADPPRRRDQRQVRGGPRGHRRSSSSRSSSR